MIRQRPFEGLASRLHAVGNAVYCDEFCGHVHDGHGCEHSGHPCGCPHSQSYDFDWEPPDELAEHWSDAATVGFLHLLSQLPGDLTAADEIESRLEWWWRGENHRLRRTMESLHRRFCERGRGVLVNGVTGEVVPARCKSWRECDYCAWVYGCQVERLLNQVKGLRAFVVFTMPPERGDWSNKDHIAAQARAIHRLRERLYRKFGRRFSMVWTREHNTHLGGTGRLHLNVVWDINWVEQQELSEMADKCGFGRVVDIRRIGRDARGVTRYATKCLRYASKELRTHADWPKGTRRWSASLAARVQMLRPARNSDWFFALEEPPCGFLPCDVIRYKTKRADRCVCCLCQGRAGHGIAGTGCLACICGAWELAGCPRELLSREDRAAPARGQPRAGPSLALQL